MSSDPLPATIDSTQLKRYADDLSKVYHAEKEKTRQLEEANQKLRAEMAARLRAELSLVESEELFRTIFETAPIGIAVALTNGSIARANKAMATILQRTPEQLKGRAHAEFVFRDDQEKFQQVHKKFVASSDESIPTEDRYVCANRQIIWCRTTFARAALSSGESTYLVLLEDITQRRQAAEEIQHLSKMVVKVQEEERSRIAFDLHDDLGQLLFALKLQLQNLFIDQHAELKAVSSMELLNSIMKRTRELSHDLSPISFKPLGLEKSISDLAGTLTRPKLTFQVELDGFDQYFEGGWSIDIYRIVQEALTNIVKHSAATSAVVAFSTQRDQVSLFIRDNGKGLIKPIEKFTLAERGGIGLALIARRAAIIGATASFESASTGGLEVRIDIPTQKI